MKTRSSRSSLLVRVLLGVMLAGLAPTAGSAASVPHRVVRGSTLEVQTPGAPPSAGPVRVRGTLAVTPQASPLDWEIARVSDLRLEVMTGAAATSVLRGEGIWRRSSRFNRMRLELTVIYGGVTVTLDSGDLPLDGAGIGLDFVLKGAVPSRVGPGTSTYILRLATVPELARWHYRLLEGSTLTDNCLVCGRPTFFWPLRGDFDLVLVEANTLFNRYHVFDARFQTASGYEVTGEGEYQLGGEVAVRQEFRLDVDVQTPGGEVRATGFTNEPEPPPRRWPMLAVDATQTNGTAFSTINLQLRAAPLREIWFSTAHNLTSGNHAPPDNHFSSGDVLSDTGQRVRSNAELLANLGWPGGKVELPIDAFTLAPGGEVWFSLTDPATSPTLGSLGAGDLLSERGRVVQRNAELLRNFGLQPPVPDLGLDGVQRLPAGETLFSVASEGFSEGLGVRLERGDILSSKGTQSKRAKELIAAFEPLDAAVVPGLDAFYVWPSGEVWFSTETGFESRPWGPITDGDLLSDQGYIVFRNRELVRTYEPLEDLANFGLDGLFVVTDVDVPDPARSLTVRLEEPTAGTIRLRWEGSGRAFQVEQTADLRDPFASVSSILPALEWTGSPLATPGGFYRIRQW